MKCVVCRHGETAPATATLTIQRETMTLVVRGVPSNVMALADSAAERGARLEACDYLAA